jgi:hypothetical protein
MLSWKRLVIILTASAVFLNPFGAYRGWVDTHQLICKAAYRMLREDPVFPMSGFPQLADILRYEGVEWAPGLTSLMNVSGTGPDVEGATNYSDHYFNPAIGQGRAPTFVAENFYRLSQGVHTRTVNADILRSAAWSAHGIADMCVPYHVVGASAAQAMDFIHSRQIFLDDHVTGPVSMYARGGATAPSGWGGSGNFENTLIAFRNFNTGAPVIGGRKDYRDWYDPWYLNGSGTELGRIITSSHATWETQAHRVFVQSPQYSGRYFDTPYHPLWQNTQPDPRFEHSPWVRQAEQAEAFAKAVATNTRKRITQNMDHPRYSIERAIMAVFTLWRASMTGVQADLSTSPGEGEYPVTMKCLVYNNVPDDALRNIHLKITTHQEGKPTESFFSLKQPIPGGEATSLKLGINVDPYKDWEIFFEITGQYSHTPDFQYISKKESFPAQIKFVEDIGLDPQNAPDIDDFDPPAAGGYAVVPDVRGLHILEAIKKIQAAGFVAVPWSDRWHYKDSSKNCLVYNVSVFGRGYFPGIKEERGTKITLYHYQGHGCLKRRD